MRGRVSRIQGWIPASPTDYFIPLWQAYHMPKKKVPSNIKNIEQVRAATIADVKRITEKSIDTVPTGKSMKNNRSILG
jgi:hypothetical protein